MILTRVIQGIIIAIPIAVFTWLLHQELVPSGTFVVRHTVDETSPFIDRLLPDARVKPVADDLAGDAVQSVVGDPAFFFVHPHRPFDTVEVEVWFKNYGVPIVELGGLANIEADAYDLKPLENTVIDQSDWYRIEDQGVVLLQREKTYDSIADFLVDPPRRDQIATYHYTLARPYRIAGYVPSTASRSIEVSLRGFHEFKTYIKDETLQFDFSYMDMNRDEGADPITLVVTNEDGTSVAQTYQADDGDVSDEARPSALTTLSVSAAGLPEGVYKVEMRAGRDVFFRSISTTQQKMVFLNNLYIGDEVAWHEPAWGARFWTQAKHLAFTTQHAEGVQEIAVGNTRVNVAAPYARTPVEVGEDGVVRVDIPKSDMIVNTDGHVAFAPEQYFNPDPVRLLYNTDLDRLDVDYIIARYTPPERVGDWYVARATFDTRTILLNEKAWKFVLSAPGIEELGGRIDVGNINMTWKRAPLTWDDLWRAIKQRL